MGSRKPIIAIMYDFDKTLSPKDMQEFSYIPSLGDVDSDEFWAESNRLANEYNMSGVNAYMYVMLKKARAKNLKITREAFVQLGKSVELYSGVSTWFKRINEYADEVGAKVEHYIISSGLKEIIEGTKIAKEFKEIYASSFLYDVNGVAVWPAMSVDYTGKTQFLYRINKGFLKVSDDSLNDFTPETKRRISFKNMIYMGDGYTDVPCMKLVKAGGGRSIVVYDPSGITDTAKKIFKDNRVDFMAAANYTADSDLEKIVFKTIDAIVCNHKLKRVHSKNKKMVEDTK